MNFSKINWVHLILLSLTPIIAIYGLFTTKWTLNTLIFSLVYYFITATGITAGYHRLFSHKSYEAHSLLKIYFAIFGAASIQGSILWWSKDHRIHHRYTDTEKDPYSAPTGLFWSHVGWMIFKKDPKKLGKANIKDLESCPIVLWQHKYYPFIASFFGILFPTLVAGLGWNDWRGGYFFAGFLRLVISHHATFCVNSLAHYLGESPYDDKHSPRDHFITALVTLGEGYHNFHHEFPQDYRNAIKYYQYDPTKWFIYVLYLFGLAYNLKTFSDNDINKGVYLMKEKKLIEFKASINWGKNLKEIPKMNLIEFNNKIKFENKQWVIIDNVVVDLVSFIDNHPGGKKLLLTRIGKDVTEDFRGGIYEHSNAANNLLDDLRVALIVF